MSILIKGIDMPKSCRTCPLNSAPPNGCLIWTINDIRKDKRNNDCPLVEIPTPHGRLIDGDLFEELIKDSVPSWTIGVKIPTYGDMDVMDKISIMPTILEAEE